MDAVRWFDAETKPGIATLYANNITFNAVAALSLEEAYKVQVGFLPSGEVVIKPLSKNEVDLGIIEEHSLFKIEFQKSFARLASAPLLAEIMKLNHFSLGKKESKKFLTRWDEKEKLLIIETKKGEQ